MKTTSLASTVSRMRFATVVLPDPVPPEMPIIRLTKNSSSCVLENSGSGRPLLTIVSGRDLVNRGLRDDSTEQLRKGFTHSPACLHDFFMVNRIFSNAGSHVCNTRDAQDLHTHLTRHDSFRDRTHSDCIGAKRSQHMNLSRRFITWSCEGCVDTAAGGDSQPPRLFNYQFLQISRINFRHVREARPKTLVVRTAQRVNAHQV